MKGKVFADGETSLSKILQGLYDKHILGDPETKQGDFNALVFSSAFLLYVICFYLDVFVFSQ